MATDQRHRRPVTGDDLLPLLLAALREPYGSPRRLRAEAIRAELIRQQHVAWSQRGGPIVRVR